MNAPIRRERVQNGEFSRCNSGPVAVAVVPLPPACAVVTCTWGRLPVTTTFRAWSAASPEGTASSDDMSARSPATSCVREVTNLVEDPTDRGGRDLPVERLDVLMGLLVLCVHVADEVACHGRRQLDLLHLEQRLDVPYAVAELDLGLDLVAGEVGETRGGERLAGDVIVAGQAVDPQGAGTTR